MTRNEKKGISKKTKPGKIRKKRRGLRAFISILIILIAAGLVFWFGWIQFRIGEGQVAVVYTKTNGYEDEALINGEFEWRWQALLPTNLTLHIYDIETRSVNLSNSGTLPSGDLYAAMAGDGVNFDWEVKAGLSYHIDPATLPALVSSGMAADGLDSFFEEYESQVEGELSRLLADTSFVDEQLTVEEIISQIEKDLAQRTAGLDDRIEVIEAVVLDWSAPDMQLYAESRRLYLEYMGLRQAVLVEVEDGAVRREDLQGARLDLLERYGSILDEYPVLLDLFALEGNPGASLLPPAELE